MTLSYRFYLSCMLHDSDHIICMHFLQQDGGRVCRPLFVVGEDEKLVIRKGHIKALAAEPDYTWTTLMQTGVVEYIDTEEEETTMIAMDCSDLQGACVCMVWVCIIKCVCMSLQVYESYIHVHQH